MASTRPPIKMPASREMAVSRALGASRAVAGPGEMLPPNHAPAGTRKRQFWHVVDSCSRVVSPVPSLASILFLATALGGTVAACASTSIAGDSDATIPNTSDPSIREAGASTDSAPGPQDAASVLGRLCHQGTGSCDPDNRNGCLPWQTGGGDAGGDASRDGGMVDGMDAGPADGSADGFAGALSQACRVHANAAPTCRPSGQAAESAHCERADDCAAGFECVRGMSGGVCRATCCSGTCEDLTQSGGKTFCDLGAALESGATVPVCSGVRPCKLLTEGTCASNETCAVVLRDGTTGCVAIGLQHVGDECDFAGCAANLTCLGDVGERRCVQLCRAGTAGKNDAVACPAGQRCVWGPPLFNESGTGVCVAGQTM